MHRQLDRQRVINKTIRVGSSLKNSFGLCLIFKQHHGKNGTLWQQLLSDRVFLWEVGRWQFISPSMHIRKKHTYSYVCMSIIYSKLDTVR